MTNEEFVQTIYHEGTDYGLCHYFGNGIFKTLTDPTLKQLAEDAKKALVAYNNYVEANYAASLE